MGTHAASKSITPDYENLDIVGNLDMHMYVAKPQISSSTDSNLSTSLTCRMISPSRTTAASTQTFVSTVGPPFVVDNALVVLLCIGKYDPGLPNLAGVPRDYDNIINTFVTIWNYKVLYRTDDDELIYTNDINVINSHREYKLYWKGEEDIDKFCEQAREKIVKNGHNGLIFVISGHGDEDKTLTDSELEDYYMGNIFDMFLPEQRSELETYKETEQESNFY